LAARFAPWQYRAAGSLQRDEHYLRLIDTPTEAASRQRPFWVNNGRSAGLD